MGDREETAPAGTAARFCRSIRRYPFFFRGRLNRGGNALQNFKDSPKTTPPTVCPKELGICVLLERLARNANSLVHL